MAKAAAADQLKLLEVQELDTKLSQLAHRARTARANPAIAEAEAKLAAAQRELVEIETAVGDTGRELRRAEGDVEVVVSRMERDQKRLDSGAGSPKDLTALQSELASLAKRRSDLEDVELEVMEKLDGLNTRQAEQQQTAEELTAALAKLTEQRDADLTDIAAETESVKAQREQAAVGIDTALLASYDKIRASHNGVGAGALRHKRCEACRMELNPRDLADIAKAAEDDVVRCEECGRILVRTGESGL